MGTRDNLGREPHVSREPALDLVHRVTHGRRRVPRSGGRPFGHASPTTITRVAYRAAPR
jgi:hypothetical protein